MTDWPTRGQRSPDFWDDQLKAYVDDADAANAAAAASAASTASGAASAASDAGVAAKINDTTPSATRAALDALYGAGGSAPLGNFYPEDYGAAGDGVADDTAEVQACIDAAYAAGGGVVKLSGLYGISGDVTVKNNVSMEGVGITGGNVGAKGFKMLADAGRVRFGNLTGHPYPGVLRNFQIDGNNVGGATTELLRVEAVETSMYDIHVMQSAGNGVDMASSQNVNVFNPNFGSCLSGAALVLRPKSAGAQPPGHCIFYGGHIGDSKKTLWVTSQNNSFFVGPHDNYFFGTIFETGRTAYAIDNVALLEDGDTHFVGCTFTIGANVTAINDNATVLIKNAIRTTGTTVATFHDCQLGGGAGAVKATDAVRVLGSGGVSNTVAYSGRITVANVTYMHCHDGGDGLVTREGPVVFITAVTDEYRTINSGTVGGVLGTTKVPRRYSMGSATGSPIQIRRDTDTVSNRLQIDRDGKLSWLDGAAGTLRGTLQRVLAGGLHFMTMGGVWLFGGGMGRTPATSTIAADQALNIDIATTSHAHLAFTANGADITALTVSNIYDGCRLTISMFGTGTNVITWPGTGTGGIVTRTTEPQPVSGAVTAIEFMGLSGKLYEVSRSG